MNIQDELIKAVESSMPKDASVKILTTSDDVRIGVSWLLNNDPARPNKRSKTIVIFFSYESIADLENLSDSQKRTGYRKLKEHLEILLNEFDPDHDHPAEKPPPTLNWYLGELLSNT